MKKVVQHRVRISRVRTCAIPSTLLLMLMLVPAAVVAQEPSPHFQVLHAFNGTDGDDGFGGVVLDAAGNLYGATAVGGDLNCSYFPPNGCGVVFKLSATGKEKVLHKFTGPDGLFPIEDGILSRDAQGNIYGLTTQGGAAGLGTVFKIDKNGKGTVVHAFTDGPVIYSGNVILDKSGNLFGTTGYGGTYGLGSVFQIDKAGKETVLYSFSGFPDGSVPMGLVEDAAGNFYGTTAYGGISGGACRDSGCGVVFKLDKTGKETTLHSFTGANGDGNGPYTILVPDKKGDLYGTAFYGGLGAGVGNGVVFKITKTGKETIVHKFNGWNGSGPLGPITFDAAGNLYGGTVVGGSQFNGTVFKLTKSGKETVLHNFTGGKDGGSPSYGVAIDASGNLYGTTQYGGNQKCQWYAAGCGVVFKITP